MQYAKFDREQHPFLVAPQTDAEIFVQDIVRKFEAWCDDTQGRIWVPRSLLMFSDFGEVYLRRDRKALNAYNRVIYSITFSRVEIKEEHRSQGLYALLVETFNQYADRYHDVGVVHENTSEPRLVAKWEREGYHKEPGLAPTYVRLPKCMRTAVENPQDRVL